ncbi:MAG: DUF2089 domain-containing protein [Chloroflexi bacterium]|nr:DUF2089 domain-containing protein [Chloroflexota bacterium]
MYPARSTCPVCSEPMVVTGLQCTHCGSELRGTFELPLLTRLSVEQMRFVEVMIKHRGSINRVSDELGISYSAGRAKLDEIIAVMGFTADLDEESGLSPDERQQVLKELAEGRITSEQALKKLRGQ